MPRKKRRTKAEIERERREEILSTIDILKGNSRVQIWAEDSTIVLKKLLKEMKKEYEKAVEANNMEYAGLIREEGMEHVYGRLGCLAPWYEIQTYMIKNEDGQMMRYEPYKHQVELYKILKKQWGVEQTKIAILKSRQLGMSTAIELYYYWWTKHNPGMEAVIISHEKKSSAWLFGMYEQAYRNDRSRHIETISPEGEKQYYYREADIRRPSGEKQLIYKKEAGGGQVTIFTGMNPDAVRSQTVQLIHASEFARYANQEEAMGAFASCVRLRKKTALILETTAQGMGDDFSDLWFAPKEGGPGFKDSWHRLFYPWFVDPRCFLPFNNKSESLAFARNMNKYEKNMMQEYKLQFSQMHWWHVMWESHNRSMRMMQQEYPCTPEEAFISSSRSVFGVRVIQHYREIVNSRECVRYMVDGNELIKHIDGDLWVYERPIANRTYSGGVDAAEGDISGIDSKEIKTDFSVLKIAKRPQSKNEKIQIVATYIGRPTTDVFARIIDVVASWYNTAQLQIEYNGPGSDVIQALKVFRGYPNIMKRPSFDKKKTRRDPTKMPGSRKYGFIQNTVSRKVLMDNIRDIVRNKLLEEYDEETINQMQALVYDSNMKEAAKSGYHDDCYMALALVLFSIIYDKPTPPQKRKPMSLYQNFKDAGDGASADKAIRKAFDRFDNSREEEEEYHFVK